MSDVEMIRARSLKERPPSEAQIIAARHCLQQSPATENERELAVEMCALMMRFKRWGIFRLALVNENTKAGVEEKLAKKIVDSLEILARARVEH
jgi:hypothetical protein